MSPLAARASLVISNFNQGFSLNASGPNDPATGGGGNGSLPPINYSEGLTNGIKETWIAQTIFTYTGPLVLGKPTTNLFIVDLLATAGTWGGGSASTDFTLNFTLDFAESFSYSRLTPTGRAGDVKLLIEGRTGNYVEVAPGDGTLGSGNYSLQVRATDTRGSSVRLEIGSPTPVPEPTTFALLLLAACGVASRRRKILTPARRACGIATTIELIGFETIFVTLGGLSGNLLAPQTISSLAICGAFCAR